MCHFRQDFSKEDLVDSNLEKLCKMTQDQRNSFLIEEFEHLMSEINCPDEYIMDLFISDIMREDYVIEKVSYRRRFEIFLNMTLFREIIRNVGMKQPVRSCSSLSD